MCESGTQRLMIKQFAVRAQDAVVEWPVHGAKEIQGKQRRLCPKSRDCDSGLQSLSMKLSPASIHKGLDLENNQQG